MWYKNNYLIFMSIVRLEISMALHMYKSAKCEPDDEKAMQFDYWYAEHMAKAMHYLVKARNLRIKERKNYGYKF